MTTREEKLLAIGLPTTYANANMTDDMLDNIYKKIDKPKANVYTRKSIYVKLKPTSKKYIITLSFLNSLLKVLKKPQIKTLTDFKDINRDDLLKSECADFFNTQLDLLVATFGKGTLRYATRNTTQNYILTTIKKIVLACGYSFRYHNCCEYIKFEDNRCKRKNRTIYSIVDLENDK